MEGTDSQIQPSSHGNNPRKSTDSSSSPEFEFWMVRNPSFPQPNIVSADQLFVNGVLLPLDLLPQQVELEPEPEPKPEPDPLPAESAIGSSASKRWKDIFKIGDRKSSNSSVINEETAGAEEKEKDRRKKERKSSVSGNFSNPAADLNINIWPFSRSRSAGNASSSSSGGRAKASAVGSRKASSAPCSRSNSAGESKSKKWPSSPGRSGLHLGRTSPVWQVRRGGGGKGSDPISRRMDKGLLGVSKEERGSEPVGRRVEKGAGNRRSSGSGVERINGGARVLNLSVPLCIGYRQHLSCSSDDSGFGNPSRSHSGSSSSNTGNHSGGSSNAPLFNLRTLFSKKVH